MHSSPNYDHCTINLMRSFASALGKTNASQTALNTLFPCSTLLSPKEIQAAKNSVLIVIDGLGQAFLDRHGQDSFLAQHLAGTCDSVFPTTTATSITSFITGASAHQHGISGWFQWLKELGQVAAILPFKPRACQANYRSLGIDIAPIVGFDSFFKQLTCDATALHPNHIVDSDFNRHACQGARSLGYETLDELMAQTIELLRNSKQPGYYYLYWPYFDELSHRWGTDHKETRQHFKMLDQAIFQLVSELKNTDTLITLTADHGMLNTQPDRVTYLDHYPEIAECLTMPVCGEPRVGYCYVSHAKAKQFEKQVTEQWAERCDLFPADDLLAAGWFGRGEVNPKLRQRIGDYVLLMKENHVLVDRNGANKTFDMVGVHGGLSTDELKVPVCQWRL